MPVPQSLPEVIAPERLKSRHSSGLYWMQAGSGRLRLGENPMGKLDLTDLDETINMQRDFPNMEEQHPKELLMLMVKPLGLQPNSLFH